MKPLDPRLIRHARSARGYIVLVAVLGVVLSGLVVAQAIAVARVVGTLASGGQLTSGQWRGALVVIGAATAGRAGAAWVRERFAHRAASHTIAELRLAVLEHTVALGPRWDMETGRAKAAGLVTRGLDSLEPYFVRYLPQLLMVVTLTPILLIATGLMDWIAMAILIGTIPFIPIMMSLIGRLTEQFSARRLATMTKLGAQVLDLISGLPTMKALGREQGPAGRVKQLSQAHAKATFGTVRIAFLSGAALELIATLSVAVVAVSVGLRLDSGSMSLINGLAVIMVAPEVLLPLRNVGAHSHASTAGLTAVNKVFDILAIPLPEAGRKPAPDLTQASIKLENLSAQAPNRDWQAPANLSGTIQPGQITALTGPNGAGKSTTVSLILGLAKPDQGRVLVQTSDGAINLDEIDPTSWWRQIAWVPQRPALLPGGLLQNLTEDYQGSPTVTPAVTQAAQAVGLDQVVAALPQGWLTPVGQGGVGLSLGQRQRLGLARALLANKPLVILDEPTAHLDAAAEQTVIETIKQLAKRGATVLLVAHRAALLAASQHQIAVTATPTQQVAA
ncbi:MAG: thiol reductant ABC exporter subunit CydD [Micrococcales bacterium]|nr:thiol reductant ABC exporter subunit CydD [Micrococcales bacterium]